MNDHDTTCPFFKFHDNYHSNFSRMPNLVGNSELRTVACSRGFLGGGAVCLLRPSLPITLPHPAPNGPQGMLQLSTLNTQQLLPWKKLLLVNRYVPYFMCTSIFKRHELYI